MTLVQSIKIFPLPRHVKIGAKKRKRYYKKSRNLPKKIITGLKSGLYIFSPMNYVIDKSTKQKIEITKRNQVDLGTPINGQLIYNGLLNHFSRSDFVIEVKRLLRPFFVNIPTIKSHHFPLKITSKLHVFVEDGLNWDVDNLWIYGKIIQDLMVELHIIPNDNVRFITHPMSMQVVMWNKKDASAPKSDGLEINIEEDLYNKLLKSK